MLTRIKLFFDRHLSSDATADDGDHILRLAVSALLLEMAHMDGVVRPEEVETVEKAVLDYFGLDASEAAELLELAEAERRESTDYFQFTSLINGAYTPQQKVRLVELLWQVAYANASVHKYEEHLVRKVADLLHVPHADFITAKHKATGGP